MLDVALGDAEIMQGVITANGLKRADVPSSGNLREEENVPEYLSQNLEPHQDAAASELVPPRVG